MRNNTQITGNIGLYYVCYKLSLLGWNAMPTSRNTRGIDIISYTQDFAKMISVQVKTLSRKSPVPLGNSLNKIIGDFWIIVNDVLKEPQIYILLPEEVKKLAHRGEKEGRISYWLQPQAYDNENYFQAWDRIH